MPYFIMIHHRKSDTYFPIEAVDENEDPSGNTAVWPTEAEAEAYASDHAVIQSGHWGYEIYEAPY